MRSIAVMLAVAVVVSLVVLAGCGGGNGWAPTARFVVFESTRDGGLGGDDIYLYNTATEQLVPLPGLNSEDSEHDPGISADGRFIVFESSRDGGLGGDDIYLYDRNVGQLVDLPGLNSGDHDSDPDISPDGRYIAFESDRTGPNNVYLYDRETEALVGLPGLNSDGDDDAALSEEARFIAFESDRDGAGDIYLYDRQAEGLVDLPGLNSENSDKEPDISADGRFIVFESNRGDFEGSNIYLYDRERGDGELVGLASINSYADDDDDPAISRDGRYICFHSDRGRDGGDDDIYMYDRMTDSFVPLPGLNLGDSEDVRPNTSQ